MTAPAHRIIIRPEAFGPNIDVVIDPPLSGDESLDRDVPIHKAACGYAGGIRMTRGLPIIDLISGEAYDEA